MYDRCASYSMHARRPKSLLRVKFSQFRLAFITLRETASYILLKWKESMLDKYIVDISYTILRKA